MHYINLEEFVLTQCERQEYGSKIFLHIDNQIFEGMIHSKEEFQQLGGVAMIQEAGK